MEIQHDVNIVELAIEGAKNKILETRLGNSRKIESIVELNENILNIAKELDEYKKNEEYSKAVAEIRKILGNKVLQDAHRGYFYDRLGDFLELLGKYEEAINNYNLSKKYGNDFAYEKITNIYFSGLLINDKTGFTVEQNFEYLIGEFKNAITYNFKAYALYGYSVYIYKEDIKLAKKILLEGIEKGELDCYDKLIEIDLSIFNNKLNSISLKSEKTEFIEKNKQAIEKLFKEAIDKGRTELIGKMGEFYEGIGYIYNAIDLYKEHIKINKDYTYYASLGDILSKDNQLLFSHKSRKKYIIEAYSQLYIEARIKQDIENFIYGLEKLTEVHKSYGETEEAKKYLDILYTFAKANDFLDTKEKCLLKFFELYKGEESYELRALSELIEIDPKYILFEGIYYENKNQNIKALNSYWDSYINNIKESEIYLGMFFDTLYSYEFNYYNKIFFKELAQKIYLKQEISKEEFDLVKDIIKK